MGTVKQLFKVANSQHGQKPLVMRVKIDYNLNGQPVSEMDQVANFPPGY
jgi:AP-1 complex subunit gamma-1